MHFEGLWQTGRDVLRLMEAMLPPGIDPASPLDGQAGADKHSRVEVLGAFSRHQMFDS